MPSGWASVSTTASVPSGAASRYPEMPAVALRISGVSHVAVVFHADNPLTHHTPTIAATTTAAATDATAAPRRIREASHTSSHRPTDARRSGASVALKNRKYGYAAPSRKPN